MFLFEALSVTNKILITSVSVWLCDWLNSETRESVSMWSFFVYTFIKLWYPLNFLCMHDSLYLCCRSRVHQAQTALMLSPHWSASFVVACLAVGSWEWEPGCGVCVWSSSLNMRNLSVQFKETAGDLTCNRLTRVIHSSTLTINACSNRWGSQLNLQRPNYRPRFPTPILSECCRQSYCLISRFSSLVDHIQLILLTWNIWKDFYQPHFVSKAATFTARFFLLWSGKRISKGSSETQQISSAKTFV